MFMYCEIFSSYQLQNYCFSELKASCSQTMKLISSNFIIFSPIDPKHHLRLLNSCQIEDFCLIFITDFNTAQLLLYLKKVKLKMHALYLCTSKCSLYTYTCIKDLYCYNNIVSCKLSLI